MKKRANRIQAALVNFLTKPVQLYHQGDYIHPGYQMDDIIALIRWMGVCRRGLRVVMVPVAIVSGPTSGRIPEDETREWARQVRVSFISFRFGHRSFSYYTVFVIGSPLDNWGCGSLPLLHGQGTWNSLPDLALLGNTLHVLLW